jgi:hypothetical protein
MPETIPRFVSPESYTPKHLAEPPALQEMSTLWSALVRQLGG